MYFRNVINLSAVTVLLLAMTAFGQPRRVASSSQTKVGLADFDFSPLWTTTSNDQVLGFIGDNYQRIRIKVLSATREPAHPDRYAICGKSMVKNNICDFAGTIRITSVRLCDEMHFGVDEMYKDSGIVKQGILQGAYEFLEDSTQAHTGIFQGFVTSAWYVDRHGRLRYDDLQAHSDSYSNNQFAGTWKGYHSNATKVCNWGDYRIPGSGDLDIGVGVFSPDDKYLNYGWQSYRDAYLHDSKRAREEEEREWWR